MKQNSSSRKVNEQCRQAVSDILLLEISDPRLDMVTVTGCEVSFDRSSANVYYTSDPSRYEDVAAAFSAASGRIRSLMARRLPWRQVPQLRFHLDPSVDEAQRIAAVLADEAARMACAEGEGMGEDAPSAEPDGDAGLGVPA